MNQLSSTHHHDIGYKELFSHPEFVQQLIEDFAPKEIAQVLDFSTLTLQPGSYITPLFGEKVEDIVWSVRAKFEEGESLEIYLYLLLEFQSSVDHTMPLRFMHYIANFYSQLYKTKQIKPKDRLPPVFPIVLYNGTVRWQAKQCLQEMIHSVPVALQPFQPEVRYYLIDEGAYSEETLEQVPTPLSAVFSIENAKDYQQLEKAVHRLRQIFLSHQQTETGQRIGKVFVRWFKRYLQNASAELKMKEPHNLKEIADMSVENIVHIKEQIFEEGLEQGLQKGLQKGAQEGRLEGKRETAKMLIRMKFGEQASKEAETRLAQANEMILDQITLKIFQAETLEKLFLELKGSVD